MRLPRLKTPRNDIGDFPWTYDQYQRYSVLKEFFEVFYTGKDIQVLDVGGVSPDRDGKHLWLPLKSIFSGESIIVDTIYCKDNNFIQANGRNLPFENNSFDVVSALDVFEHIPEKGRENFIKELARVSKGSLFLSAPFNEKSIEQIEGLVFDQIKKLYGLKHLQLLEHKRCGLPDVETTNQTLSKFFTAGESLSYGSLYNWLFNQTIKNCFLFKKNSKKIHYFLDKWIIYETNLSEFDPPFSHHFWMYSKDISKEDLRDGVSSIKINLKNKESIKTSLSDLVEFNQEIVRFSTHSGIFIPLNTLSRFVKKIYYKAKLRFFI